MIEVQYTPTMYEEIMKNSPTMRGIFEGKIAEEVGKKQAEIDDLKQQLAEKDAEIQQLQTDGVNTMLALTDVYEDVLTIKGGTI